MNLEQARFNMVEQQIRTWDVLDQDVLDLLFEVKREEFLPERARALAFVDMAAPIGFGEFSLPPKLEARIVQELGLKKSDHPRARQWKLSQSLPPESLQGRR